VLRLDLIDAAGGILSRLGKSLGLSIGVCYWVVRIRNKKEKNGMFLLTTWNQLLRM
jgi:hypothetical protein